MNKTTWQRVKLGEVAEIKTDIWKVGGEQEQYIGLEHIAADSLRLCGIGNSNEVSSNKYIFKENDILFGKLRPYFRKIIKAKFKGICSTDIWVIRAKQNIDQTFLFYFFANKTLINLSYSSSKGTRMPRADWNFLSQTTWLLPPLETQHKIAEILSSLDDKIDLLHRQNKTLESLSLTLFRHTFIDNPKRNEWEMGKLGDYVMPKKGKNITQKNAIRGIYPVIAGGLEPAYYHNQSNTQSPVITISASGANAGFINIHYCPVWSSDSSYIDSTITPYVYFSYLFLKHNQNILYDKQEGSAQPHIYPSHIMELEMPHYPKELMESFETQIQVYFDKISHNMKEIQNLESLRDIILPKLLSGEMEV